MPNHGNVLSARVHLSLKTLTAMASLEGQSTDMISTSVFASRQLPRPSQSMPYSFLCNSFRQAPYRRDETVVQVSNFNLLSVIFPCLGKGRAVAFTQCGS